MGRKKKIKNETGEAEPKEEKRSNIAGDAKRSAVAVFLFALALVMIFGFFGKAGVVGNKLSDVAGMIIGWAKLIFPAFLILAGIVLLMRKETSFYVTKFIGLTLMLLAIVAFLHWFTDLSKMKKLANAGEGGGYIGYALAYVLGKYLEPAGSLVVIIAMFFIGIIVAFNFSFVAMLSKLRKKEAGLAEEPKMVVADEIGIADTHDKISDDKKETEPDSENNIAKIEFVEGPDQFVSPSLAQDATIGPENSDKALFNKRNLSQKISRSIKNKWIPPPLDLLEKSSGGAKGGDVEKNAEIIERALRNFGIEVERGEIKTGPSVTQYSFRPAVGIKIAKIMALQNDLALALAAHPIRIEAPIPGKSLIGIEVPNKVSAVVRLRGILESDEFKFRSSNSTLALGEDVNGNFIFGDLTKMPHLLIAGATGTGKSICINSIITTLLYQNSPEDLKFIMVDPKRVELSQYNDIPHLKTDVIVDNGKVVNALKWAVSEMERRYRLLQDVGCRDVGSYKDKQKSGKKRKYTNPETNETVMEDLENLPYIVIIIDELADLMGSHGKEVEGAIVRIAQMARAVGIHLIISTQRPSVEVITGLIKANITTRIAFQVATQIDSRTILDMGGAEKLLGRGDMLYLSATSAKPKRIQGVFMNETEVKQVVKFIKGQKLDEEGIGEDITGNGREEVLTFSNKSDQEQGDEFYEAAKEEVIRAKKASASLLQRRLRVGYARAARLLDLLEEKGIVGPSDGAKPREVYVVSAEKAEVSHENNEADQETRDKWQI